MLKKVIAIAFVVLAGVFGAVAVSQNAMAKVSCPVGSLRGDGAEADTYAQCNVAPDAADGGLMKTVQIIINVVLGLIGLITVVVIIIGGVGFVTSQGDAAKVTKAKNTVLYGVIGLVISLLAFAIVNFVLSGVFNGNATDNSGGNNPQQQVPAGNSGDSDN